MRHRLLSACAALLLGFPLWASGFTPDLSHLDTIPEHALPLQVVAKSVQAAQSKSEPYAFAVGVALPQTLTDGVWQQADADTWSWRMRVFSASAQTLYFHFSQLRFPTGAALWIYDAAGQRVEGPYTQANETPDGQLWTAVVPGETAVLELRVPAAAKNQVQLQLAEAYHGFRGFEGFGKSSPTGSYEQSGACEIDVACPTGQSWLTQASALARIEFSTNGTGYLCSGQLVNDVPQDNTPFFLTANHCINSGNAGTVVFYWNYQRTAANCNNSSSPEPSYQTQSGAVFVASDAGSDFALIKPTALPLTGSNLYLSGWDANSADTPQSGAVVHHPAGDVTKIAVYSRPATPTSTSLCEGSLTSGVCTGNSVTVQTWQVSYSQGVTEPGSSGSALYNQNQQLVGQLSGGSSACTGNTGNGLPDVYGRTDVAWTANGTNGAASGQLKANLDPKNSGTLSMPGMDYSAAAGSSSGGSSSSGSSSGGNSGSSSSNSGHGGEFTPLTLAGLLLLVLLRRTPDILRRRRQRQNSGA